MFIPRSTETHFSFNFSAHRNLHQCASLRILKIAPLRKKNPRVFTAASSIYSCFYCFWIFTVYTVTTVCSCFHCFPLHCNSALRFRPRNASAALKRWFVSPAALDKVARNKTGVKRAEICGFSFYCCNSQWVTFACVTLRIICTTSGAVLCETRPEKRHQQIKQHRNRAAFLQNKNYQY